jgi:hypothetical protein
MTAQSLYIKFNLADSSNLKRYAKNENYPINRYGYREQQALYGFFGTFTTPHVVASVEWWNFDEHFITIDKNNFQLIEESTVNSCNPLNIEQLGAVLQPKHPTGRTEYFDSFQKIFIIEMGLPNNKAKVIEVKRYLGHETKW